MPAEVDPFDMDAAILRKSDHDIRAFLSALATRLAKALPGRVVIERKRDSVFSSNTHVVKIELAADNAAYTIALDRSGLQTTRSKVVHGVTIAKTSLPTGAWMDEVRAAVAQLSGSAETASTVLGKFL